MRTAKFRNKRLSLTTEKVLAMRKLAALGIPGIELAKQFGVSTPTVTLAITGQTWCDAGGPIRPRKPAFPYRHGADVIWKSIPGWEPYSASSGGDIRINIDRRTIAKGELLYQNTQKGPWLYVSVTTHKKRTQTTHVARLVHMAFHGPFKKGMTVNHKNGDPTDNRPENLEAMTVVANIRHSIQVLGRRRDGIHNPATHLTKADVIQLREQVAAGVAYDDLAAYYGIGPAAVRQIAAGATFAKLGGPRTRRPTGRPRAA